MTTQTEALTLALEALKDAARHLHPAPKQNEAITAIKESLAQQSNEQVEPYAIEAGYDNGDGTYSVRIERLPRGLNGHHKDWSKLEKLLYTHPPVSTAQPKPLTDKEIDAATQYWAGAVTVPLERLILCREYARAIEAAHGIRPTDFKE